jgi:serine/tyrosine/threonine adenylyltransferase
MGRKLGFARSRDGDQALIQDLHRMADYQADFTATFRPLCEASTDPSRDADVRALVSDPAAYDAWALGCRARLVLEDDAPESRRTRMRSVNPAFIPRNHRIEAAIRDAEAGRYDAFHELNNVLARPFEDQAQSARYAQPPAPHEEVLQTWRLLLGDADPATNFGVFRTAHRLAQLCPSLSSRAYRRPDPLGRHRMGFPPVTAMVAPDT